VLAAKGADGALRHSVHRIATELLYLPIPSETRARIKPLIDGAIARFAQAAVACVLLATAELGWLQRSHLVALVCGLVLAWLMLAAQTRKPYLQIFRSALARDGGLERLGEHDLDLATVEIIVERLAHPNPDEVIAAMRVLAVRGRVGLVPGLVLYHPAAEVLVFALDLLGASERTDWIKISEPLIGHADENVRMAALRALCKKGRKDLLKQMLEAPEARIRGYSGVWLALRELRTQPRFGAELMERSSGDDTDAAYEGMLAAIADAPKLPELGAFLLRLVESRAPVSDDVEPDRWDAAKRHAELFSLAATNQEEVGCIPILIQRLGHRFGREAIRLRRHLPCIV
jgi:hypothetical protein